MNNYKGFTLIELLVVIAIIGILASIVVVSLSDQTGNARDAKNKAALAQLPTQALVYANENGGSYTGLFTAPAPNCDTNICKVQKAVNSIKVGITTATEFNVEADGQAWGADFKLENGDYYCSDSTGFKGERSNSIGSSSFCPLP